MKNMSDNKSTDAVIVHRLKNFLQRMFGHVTYSPLPTCGNNCVACSCHVSAISCI